jgi:hypothetical protein
LTVFSASPSSWPIWAVGAALGDQAQDPFLLGRQARQLLVLEQVLAFAEPVQHAFGDGRVQQALAGPHGPDGPEKVGAADLFEDVAGRAGHDRGEQGLVVGEAGQHQDLGGGAGGADVAGGLDPGAVGEADVHHDHIGQGLGGDRDRVAGGAGLGAHDHVGDVGEQQLDAVADDLMVIDQHHPQRRGAHGPIVAGLASLAQADRVGSLGERMAADGSWCPRMLRRWWATHPSEVEPWHWS